MQCMALNVYRAEDAVIFPQITCVTTVNRQIRSEYRRVAGIRKLAFCRSAELMKTCRAWLGSTCLKLRRLHVTRHSYLQPEKCNIHYHLIKDFFQ